MDCNTPGLPVHHHLLELAQTHVRRVGDAIQSSHPLLSPSPPAFSLSQNQGLFQWVRSSHQVAKVLELQHQSFQWLSQTDFLRINWLDLLAIQGTLKSLLQQCWKYIKRKNTLKNSLNNASGYLMGGRKKRAKFYHAIYTQSHLIFKATI